MGSFDDDLAICQKITRQGGSNLSMVSKGLSPVRQAFFAPAYASMRLIDDLVDECFLALPKDKRESERASYLARLEAWEKMSTLAAEGEIAACDFKFKLPEQQALAVFRALAVGLGKSNLGAYPWQMMAEAMRRDICETPIESWEDFEAYGWGATVSPTAVYLYILTCDYNKATGEYSGVEGPDLMALAKPMGLFCYLVHIARDLQKDLEKTSQLLTLPRVLLKSDCSSNRDNLITTLISAILDQAQLYKDQLDAPMKLLQSKMSLKNKLVFKSIFGLYMSMFNEIKNNPSVVQEQGFEDRIRRLSGVAEG